MRKLDDKFMKELKEGDLKMVLDLVHRDQTLCLEIRDNCIKIYYRGGNILQIEKEGSKFTYAFDPKYFVHDRFLMSSEPVLPTSGPVSAYLELIPILKQEMDRWFKDNPKLEREVQQMILRDNNTDKLANDTDYYISDIEYSDPENKSRFDIVAIKWLSTSVSHKDRTKPSLSIIELKYGDDSLTKDASIVKHVTDIERYVNSPKYSGLLDEIEIQINQKIELGLIYKQDKPLFINKHAKPEFVFIFVNHKAASTILNRELKIAMDKFPNIEKNIDVLIAQSSFMGYGLYIEKMIKVSDYLKTC